MAETSSSVSQPLQTEDEEESIVANAKSVENVKEGETGSPLKLTWSFGFNCNVSLHNVSDANRKVIFYVTAHTAILHDFVTNTQRLLQGHRNSITCSTVSGNKRWIATGDQGDQSMVIVWDSYSCVPVRTLFNPHSGGVAAVAMTLDAEYLATLGASSPQSLSLWKWTASEKPLHTIVIDPSLGLQTHLVFNPSDSQHLMSTSEHQVIFYSWDSGELKYHAPTLTDKTFNKTVGTFSQSAFIPSTTRAMTGTSEGMAVLWDHARPDGPGAPPVTKHPMRKKALKMVRLQEAGMTSILQFGEYQVTGDALGHVRFYDAHLCLVNWWDNFNAGPVTSVSFAHSPKSTDFSSYVVPGQYPNDATIRAGNFVVPDFTVATSRSIVLHTTTKGGKIDVLLREHERPVHALASHPFHSKLLVGSYTGFLKLWDYEKKTVLASRNFEQKIQCLTFDPKGQFVSVGFTNGMVRVLDSLTLADDGPVFRHSHGVVTHVAFSHDSRFMATADDERRLVVFKRAPAETFSQQPWEYLGKYRAHHKPIQDILFGVALDSSHPRLLSLGLDRVLVEYDLSNSSIDDVRLLSSDRIEQSAVPSCLAWYPAVTKESFLVTASDQFKFKLYNSTTKMCRKTVLGPTYGTPARKISVLPYGGTGNGKRRYIAFITQEKIGLSIVPLDGNPFSNAALTAHPGGISDVAHSHDGKYVFTSGGDDLCVNMWKVNTDALDALALLGGDGLVPFYSLLEGGRDGELFAELEDYFYYAQLKHQGINTMNRREVSSKVPLSEVPGIMRALGFFPSEQDIEDMLNEAKYSEYVDTGKYVTEIDLGELIKLYVNHRPVFGLDASEIEKAFRVLAISGGGVRAEDGDPAVDRGYLLELLQSRGEHFTESELADHLGALFGHTADGLDVAAPDAAAQLEDGLPEKVTAGMLSSSVLGFLSETQ